MSIPEAAEHFGKSRNTLYEEAKSGFIAGDIPVIKIGRSPMLPRDLVMNLVERRRSEKRAS
jgi:hypothetical protein